MTGFDDQLDFEQNDDSIISTFKTQTQNPHPRTHFYIADALRFGLSVDDVLLTPTLTHGFGAN